MPYGEAFARIHMHPRTALPLRLSKLITEGAQLRRDSDGRVTGGKFRRIDGKGLLTLSADEFIHFKYSNDPERPGHGLSKIEPAVIASASDTEAGLWMYGILSNEGIPGLVVMPEKDTKVNKQDQGVLRRLFTQMLRGINRGRPLILSKAYKIERPGFNPNEFDLTDHRYFFTKHVCTTFGISPVTLNIAADGSSTYTNYRESVKYSYKRAIVPMQRKFARVMSDALLPYLGSRGDTLEFDVSDVEALQEDRSEKVKRLTVAYRGGWVKRKEVRESEGLPVSEEDDYYFVEPETIRIKNQESLRQQAQSQTPNASGNTPSTATVSAQGDNREPGL